MRDLRGTKRGVSIVPVRAQCMQELFAGCHSHPGRQQLRQHEMPAGVWSRGRPQALPFLPAGDEADGVAGEVQPDQDPQG